MHTGTAPKYEIIDLGTLGGISSVALGINEQGQVVGNADTAQGLRHAYVWQNGVMTDLGTWANDPQSEAWDINDVGHIVGISFAPGERAVRWDQGNIMLLGTLGGESSAFAINNAGQVVGSSQLNGFQSHAFLWQAGVITDLGTLGGTHSIAWDINEAGVIAGSSFTSGAERAVIWIKGTIQDIGTLGGTHSEAFGINDSTQVVGWAQHTPGDKFYHAFLWQTGTMTDVIGGRGLAEAINNLGQIVGAQSFLHDPERGTQDLDDLIAPTSGWTDLSPRDINDAGQIVGSGTIEGRRHAFLMTPPPPSPRQDILALPHFW